MFKKIIALFMILSLLSFSMVLFADASLGDSNTNVNDSIDDNINFLELNDSSDYCLTNGYVMNVGQGTTVVSFKNNFINSANIKILDNPDYVGLIKTGDVVRYGNNDDHIVVVSGDVSFDGKTTVLDVTKVLDHVLSKTLLTANSAQFMAPDLTLDGTINVLDVLAVVNVALN